MAFVHGIGATSMSSRRLSLKAVLVFITMRLLLPSTASAYEVTPAVDPWLGATLGGVVGSTVGHGDGRTVATVVDAIVR